MNDINTLMSRVEEINRIDNPRDLTDSDITTLITFHRRARARKAAGLKSDAPSRPTVDISKLLNLPAPRSTSLPSITRR